MITITVLKNPFNHGDKEIHACKYVPGKTVYEYIQPYVMGLDEFVVSLSGSIVEDAKAQLVGSDDWLAVCPVVGKSSTDWFRTIGMLALGVAVGGLNAAWTKGLSGAQAFWRGMAAGAIGMIGGTLINHWFPPAQPDRPTVTANPAYNWNTPQSLTDQGSALAVTYGIMRTAGQVVAQHVSSDGDNQYLNVLLCGGEGPIDDISDIRINDNPISYYKDVTVETRLGVNDQLSIANFNDTYIDQALAYELDTDNIWITQQTDGNAVEGLEITLQLPYGLYHVKDDGGLENASVTVQLQYHKMGEENWNDLTTAVISTAQNTAFQRTYRIDNLPAAQYEVRALCESKSGTDTRYSTRVFWTQLSDIIYDDFARPGKVLVGIKALATNQLSGGMPNITWLQTRNNVWVFNADTGQYEQKAATNPVWAAYDMIHRCRQIKNVNTGDLEFTVQGAPAARAVYQDFVNWAAFCDSRNLTFNYIFDTATDLWTALQKPENVGRGKVIMRGTRFGAVCDAPGQPVQLFTVGNMITDQFKETFVGLKDRANVIEITFINEDKDYQKDLITVYADDYTSETIPNITQITLDGITTLEQAYREGKYRLRLNQYLQRTVDHSADIDAIACQVNDVVLLAHDVPQWGFSGRLLGATATTLQLDRQVTLEPGKYYAVAVQVTNPLATTSQDAQSIMTASVQGVAQETVTDTLIIAGSLTQVPLKWDLYSFGETNKVVKPFRVLNISRDQDFRRKISCLEYIEEIYTEATDIPEINYSALDTTVVEVTSLNTAEESYLQKDGTIASNLNVSWTIPRNELITGYEVLFSTDNGTTWTEWATGINALSTPILGVKTNTTYLVKVCTINDVGIVSSGVISDPIYITGKDTPPANVAGFSYQEVNGGFLLSWQANTEIDLAGYNVYQGNNNASLDASTLIAEKNMNTNLFVPVTQAGQYAFHIVAVDTSGNVSVAPATILASFTLPADVDGFDVVRIGDDLDFRWQPVSGSNITYEIRRGTSWDIGQGVGKTTSPYYRCLFPTPGDHDFWIKAIDSYGNYSFNAQNANVVIVDSGNRNAVVTIDQVAGGWLGSSINTHVNNGGLQLDDNAIRGEHIVEVNLPKSFTARNTILADMIGVQDTGITWGSANFTWDDIESQTPWEPDGDITGATLDHQISIFSGIPANIIESIPLDASVLGDNGTLAQEAAGVTYGNGRFRQGAVIQDTTKLSWIVSIPAAFHTLFYISVTQPIADNVVYMTLKGPNGYLMVGYDLKKSVFYLQDHVGNRNEVSIEFKSTDYLLCGIVQNATTRTLYMYSFAANAVGDCEQAYTPVGNFTAAFLYPKFN